MVSLENETGARRNKFSRQKRLSRARLSYRIFFTIFHYLYASLPARYFASTAYDINRNYANEV